MSGRCERRMPQRHPERFPHDLRRCGGSEELAPAARRSARPASEIGGLLQRDLTVHVADADGLDPRRILALNRQQA